ncbi:MAG: lipopolysaccharide heptosyltransferase I [Sulfurimonas sp.]|nr:lipopolysaccharide heptosyltransferase I [Sulfurimonas sp.]MDQ7062393.1 lipopolysaccharide heptosyltransferase I [Sulfurimonas sp.]
MNTNIKKIALVRLSALGDIVNSSVVLQFIHAKFPNAKINWITEEVFSPLLYNHPLIDAVHSVNIKQLKKEKSFSLLKKTISDLRVLGSFDIIIDMQGLIKSSIVARILGKNTHGFDKNSTRESLASLLYQSTSHIAYDENIVRRNCFIVSDALDFEITDAMLLQKNKVFPNLKPYKFASNEKKNIALVIGASWKSKKYPKEKVLQLCDELEENCHIVWGSEEEKEEALWICEHSASAILAPKLSLVQLVSYIEACDLLIGNDTGPTHMAWAQNIPSITLFGPTSSRMIYKTPQNVGIKSPSFVDIFKINKNDFSIKEIDFKEIAQKARELLKNAI